MNTHELIRDFRERVHGWSLIEASSRLGMTASALSRRESGETELSLAEASTFAAVYGIPIERLHGLEPRCVDCGSAHIVLRPIASLAPRVKP